MRVFQSVVTQRINALLSIPQWEVDKSEPWTTLTVTGFAFGNNFCAGRCFSEKSAVGTFAFNGSSMFKGIFLTLAELFWHSELHCLFFFSFLFWDGGCLFFVFIVVGCRQRKTKGFQIQQSIADRGQQGWEVFAKRRVQRTWKPSEVFEPAHNSVPLDTLTRLHIHMY